MNRTPEDERRRQRIRNIDRKLATIRYCLQHGNDIDNPDRLVTNALKSLKHYGYDYETNSVTPFRTWSRGSLKQPKTTKRIPLEEERRDAFKWLLHKTDTLLRSQGQKDLWNAGLPSLWKGRQLVSQEADTTTLISRFYYGLNRESIQQQQVATGHINSI